MNGIKKVILLSLVISFICSNYSFAKNYDISKISKIQVLKKYGEKVTMDELDFVTLGSYPQSDEDGNTKEPIEWIVFGKNGNKYLLLSKYILDCKCFNDDKGNTNWETCSLRKWLNNEFYNEAFNSNEKKYIKKTRLKNDNTKDRVFLLSLEELNQYIKFDKLKTVNGCYQNVLSGEATKYAKEVYNDGEYLSVNSNGYSGWWFRNHLNNNRATNRVDKYDNILGGYNISNTKPEFKHYGIRPAIWVSVE